MRTGKQPLGLETHKRPGGGQSEVAEEWGRREGRQQHTAFPKMCQQR